MNLTNYHSHCSFCDGKAPMEDFVKSAIAAGFTSYGISSHAPLPFETCWTLSQERVPDYLQEIGRLKQRYAGEIEIYAGLEIDYLNEESHPAIPRFQEFPVFIGKAFSWEFAGDGHPLFCCSHAYGGSGRF